MFVQVFSITSPLNCFTFTATNGFSSHAVPETQTQHAPTFNPETFLEKDCLLVQGITQLLPLNSSYLIKVSV